MVEVITVLNCNILTSEKKKIIFRNNGSQNISSKRKFSNIINSSGKYKRV